MGEAIGAYFYALGSQSERRDVDMARETGCLLFVVKPKMIDRKFGIFLITG